MASNDFITQEVEKIIKQQDLEFPLNLAMASAWILGNLKGLNLKIINTKKFSTLGDYYVLASATNITQSQAMAQTIQTQLKKHQCPILSVEGEDNADWILVDLGDVIVHIFLESTREVFDLDSLWDDAPIVEIPNEYYFEEQNSATNNSTQNKDYF